MGLTVYDAYGMWHTHLLFSEFTYIHTVKKKNSANIRPYTLTFKKKYTALTA